MRRCSPPTFACWLLESLLPDPYREAALGDLIEEYALRIESTSRFTASRWFWESSLSIFTAHGLVLASEPRLSHQHKHRYRRVHLHGNTEVCCGLDDLEVSCPRSVDACRSCADRLSHDNRNRWLRRCTNPPGRNDFPGTDGHDYGCHFDRRKGLQHTGAVVVSVWISHTRSPDGDHPADTVWTPKATRNCHVNGPGTIGTIAD